MPESNESFLELEEDSHLLESLAPDGTEIRCSSRTNDETLWTVGFFRSDGPTEFFVYDQVKKTTSPLFVSKPDLLQYKLAPMEDVRIQA